MGRRIDLVGQTFGRWFVESQNGPLCVCTCECGTHKEVQTQHLRTGKSKSCGCLNGELAAARKRTHGESVHGQQTPEYLVWRGIVRRCTEPANKVYADYGGRGIRIHEPWLDYATFLRDVGRRPAPHLTFDRIDNDGHYEPGNVRWATRREQARNQRRTIKVVYEGREMTLAEAAEQSGIPYAKLWYRYRTGAKAMYKP